MEIPTSYVCALGVERGGESLPWRLEGRMLMKFGSSQTSGANRFSWKPHLINVN